MSIRAGFIGLGNQGKPIAAHLAPAGFETTVYDIVEAPKKWRDHDDYEYIVTIRKNDKDRLLLALIEATFGDDASAVSRFRDFAREKDIPNEWFTWP